MRAEPRWEFMEDLCAAALAAEGAMRVIPKWNSACMLRSAGLPVLRSALIRPSATHVDVGDALTAVVERFGQPRLLVRSDGGRETGSYYSGGDSLHGEKLDQTVNSLHSGGRAVILMEPTNRLINNMSVEIRMERDKGARVGSAVLEALGPGFDGSDLRRGSIEPVLRATWSNVDWHTFERPWWSDVVIWEERSEEALEQRREQRLDKIRNHILPALADTSPSLSQENASRWLREHGYDQLWRPFDRGRLGRSLNRWYEDAWLASRLHPNPSWTALSLSFSDLGDGRNVYWDLVDGAAKYGRRRE